MKNEIFKESELINFSDLEYSGIEVENINTKNILILGDITYGTGNLITAQRMKRIFNKLGYNSFLFNIRYLLSGENKDYTLLKKFIKNKNIGLIVGINIWRSGKIIYDLLNDGIYFIFNKNFF